MRHVSCIWLAESARLSLARQAALLRGCESPERLLAMSARQAARICGELTAAEAKRFENKSLRRAHEIAEKTGRLGYGMICFYDDGFPEPLRHIPDPPAILYVRGRLPDFSAVPAIAVVGKRAASAAGLQIAEKMGYALSRAGVVVVSGMAEGCDSAAHRGALLGGSPTVAVLGTPLDRPMPPERSALLRDITGYGAVISEYAVDRPYFSSDYPRRNRLISGLSLGLVVCEAASRSGTLQTARLALDQGRDVFAVPGAIGMANYEGTNELIASAGAQLVTTPDRVLAEYAGRWEALGLRPCEPRTGGPAPYRPEPKPAAPRPKPKAAAREAPPAGEGIGAAFARDLPHEQQRIYDALDGPRQVDELIEKSGLSAGEALQALTFLEIAGLVRQLPGKRYQRS